MKGTQTHEHIHKTTFVPKLKNERTNLWLNECCSFTLQMCHISPGCSHYLAQLQVRLSFFISKRQINLKGIPSECFSSWNRKRHWDTTLRYIINLTLCMFCFIWVIQYWQWKPRTKGTLIVIEAGLSTYLIFVTNATNIFV